MESLDRDPTLLDYFNTFLSSEAFTIHLRYDLTLRDFTIVDDGASPLEVEAGCRQKFLSWVERERYQPFLRSRLYLQYRLCVQLMDEFQQMVAREALPPVPHHSDRRRSRTTPTPITLLRPQPPPVQRGRLPSIDSADTALARDSHVTSEGHSHGRQLFLESAIRNMDIVSILGKVSGMDHFIQFLQSTKGRDLVDLWMDVQELKTLQGSGAERAPPTCEGQSSDSGGGYLWMPAVAHADYLSLKYSHFLACEEGKDKRTLVEAQDLASRKLQTYWLPRYLLQVYWAAQHQGVPKAGLGSRCLPPSSPWQLSDRCYDDDSEHFQSVDPFTAGLWAESAVGRPLLKYLNQNGMRGLAGMLLFWQAVEELRLVEYRQVEPAVRDRLAWTVYKTFLHEEGSHVLPVMDKDKSAILSQLHDSHVIARSDAFHELQKLCLSSLKRAWSSYLRTNYDHFLRQVTRTPSLPPPAATPTPTPDLPQPSATSNEGGKKKKRKKKARKMKRAVSTLDDDMPGSIHSLVKGKTWSNFGSQSRLSRLSRTSRGRTLQLSDLDPLASNIEACQGPLTPKLEAFRLFLEGTGTDQDSVNSSVKNLDFCVEVEKFKSMVSAAADVLILQSKVEAIVDSYLDLARPPWLLVAIPSHIVQKVVETASQHMQGFIMCPSMSMIYRELEHLEWAKQVLLVQLTPFWSEFLSKWNERSRREEELSEEQVPSEGPESVDTVLSLTCRLPAIPSAGTNAEKMKITYSLTTGAFWTKLSKSHSAKPPSTAAAPPPLFAFN